jgi:PAS domain S-box-containing protein
MLAFASLLIAIIFFPATADVIHTTRETSISFPSRATPLNLTKEEREFLAHHRSVRVAFDGHFPPYSYINEKGEFEGLAIDITRLLAERIGVRIEIFPDGLWKNLYEAAKQKKVDVVATMVELPERRKWFVFTRPYIFKSLVIMTRKDGPVIEKREDIAGKTIALVRGYQYVPRILAEFPSVTPYYVDTMLDGLNAVATGKADGAITFLGAGYYLKTKYLLSNLKFSAVYDRNSSLESFAVRKDWPELVSILDKALSSYDHEQKDLQKKWNSDEFILTMKPPGQAMRKEVLISLAGVFVLLITALGGVYVWNRSLKRQVTIRTAELTRELEHRKKAEASLKESEQYNRLLFEAFPIGLALCGMDGRFIDVNPAYARIIGRTVEETLKLTNRDITPEKYAEQEERQLERLRKTGRYGPYEKEYIHKDCHLVPVRLNGLIVQRGGEDFIWSSVEDITERRKAEEELDKHREHLEELVRERTAVLEQKTLDLEKSRQALRYLIEDVNESRRELEEANKKLQELDRLKSMFIASMSHELRTPLNSIIGFTSITLQGLSGELNEEQRDNLTRAHKAALHLLELITDVIDISKIEAGRIDVFPEEFSLRGLLDEAVSSIMPQAGDKGLSIDILMHEEIQIHTDRRRLMQCVLNLLSNAVKYTEEGWVRIEVKKLRGSEERKGTRAEVQAQIGDSISHTLNLSTSFGDCVEISVTDTGIGIAEEDMPKLFEPFERLQTHLRVKAGGTGLGLYLTRKIMTELLHGSISVQSIPGKGSIFSLRIPVKMEGASKK